MSTEIDEKIVEMRFDNRQFESNVRTSLSTLDKLKQSLRLENASKGFEQIGTAAKNLSLEGISAGIEALQNRFSTFGIIGMRVLENMTDSVMGLANRTIQFLTNSIVQGGITRAMNLENAHFQLQGLLKDEEAVSAVMKNVSDSVDGTAYSLDSAAKVASQLAASGMRAGDQMYSSLRAVAGVAAMTNSEYDSIGQIFTTVAGNGRLMGDQLLQLSSRGLNAASTLAEYLTKVGTGAKVTEADVREMVSKGEISFQIFADAMDDAFGEHAKKANETFTGAMSNVKAALARIGAEFVSPLVVQNGPLVAFFNTLRERINDVKANIGPLADIFVNTVTTIANAATAYLGQLDLSEHFEAFYNIVDTLKNMLDGLWSVVKPIGQAFSDIFPPVMISNVVKFTSGLKEFSFRLRLSDKSSENLKNTFKGLFAILDIVRQAVSAVHNGFRPFLKLLPTYGGDILEVTGNIGQWVVKLDEILKKNKTFQKVVESVVSYLQGIPAKINTIFQSITGISIGDAFDSIHQKVSDVAQKLKEAFDSFKNVDTSGLDALTDKIKGRFEPLGTVFDGMKKVLVGIWEFFKKLSPIFSVLATAFGNALGSIGDSIMTAVGDADFDGILDILNGGVLVMIGTGIKNLIDSLTSVTKDAGGAFGSIKGILDGVKGCLQAYQQDLKASTLLKIAGAIGILTASVIALSLIDSAKLSSALAVMAAEFGELFASMMIFEKIAGSKGFTGMEKIAGMLLTMSGAILILSFAVKSLADLDWDGVLKGTTGVAALSAILVVSANQLSKSSGKLIKGASGLVIFALAIRTLVNPVKELGAIDAETLKKGLIGVGVLCAELALFLKGADLDNVSLGKGLGLLALSGAVTILSSAVSRFAEMDTNGMLRGLAGVGVVLAELAIFTRLTGNSKNVITTAVGMTILGSALNIITKAVSAFGNMSWEELQKGLGAVAVSLALVAVATGAMKTALPGAAALLVVAGALAIFAPVLKLLGSMSIAEIGKSLLALAGTFAVVGVAGLLLGPIVPAILALAGAVALLGVGVLACGAGLLTFSAGLSALAVAGAAGIAAFVLAIEAVLSLIPQIVVKIGEGVLALLIAIGDAAPELADATVKLVDALITAVIDTIPLLVEALVVLVDSILSTLAEHTPSIVQSAIDIVITLLDGIRNNIGEVVEIVIGVIVEVLEAIAEKTPDVIQAGIDIIVNLIDGLAQGIEDNSERIHEALLHLFESLLDAVLVFLGIHSPSTVFADIGTNVIQGLINGMNSLISNVKSTVINVANNAVSAIGSKVGQFLTKGKELMTNLKTGISNKLSDVKEAAVNVISNTLSGIREKLSEFTSVGSNLINGLKEGIQNAASGVVSAAKVVVSDAVSAAKNLLGIHSPSKVFAELGRYTDEGFVQGLQKYASKVMDASEDVGNCAIRGMSHIISGIADALESDMDTQPTIRPVLDLSNVESGASRLSNLFSRSQAMTIHAGMSQESSDKIQNGSTDSSGNTYQFTQNNYSPKALSRLEIYRQTKNQFSAMKGFMKT